MESKLPRTYFLPVSENLQKLADLFPEAVKDGQLDVAALKEEMGQFEEVSGEKYELTWPGKKEAKRLALTDEDVADMTLKYLPGEGLDEEKTENLYIEGDNLEVLKLLRNSYYGKIKMIYIDPPYNTGNDFVYRDKFTTGVEETAKAEGELDEYGQRMVINQKSNARYHSNWMNMIYPRLRVAKDLLRDDGLIFISIDDNEVRNLRAITDEIFGDNNFVACIVWKKKTNGNNVGLIPPVHDFIVVYAKNINNISDIGYEINTDYLNCKYSNPDNDPRGPWDTMDLSANHKGPYFKITNPKTGEGFWPPEGRYWVFNEDDVTKRINEGRIIFGKTGTARPVQKVFASERNQKRIKAETWWDAHGMNEDATNEAKVLFDNPKIFSHPKPTELLKHIVSIASSNDDIVLDFFSGSGTAANAVMAVNAEKKHSHRKFILAQLPEDLVESLKWADNNAKASIQAAIDFLDEQRKPLYLTEIGKERIRRASAQIREEITEKRTGQTSLTEEEPVDPDTLDLGFKVFKVSPTNIRWNTRDFEALLAGQTEMKQAADQVHMGDIVDNKDLLDFQLGTKDIDVVYEVMLRHRDFPLSTPVMRLDTIGNRTFIFADAVVVCLESEITNKMVDDIAALQPKPLKVVFRDSAFGDDVSMKLNAMNRLTAQLQHYHGGEDKAFRVEFI